jgi:hypothetical protein
MLLLLLCSDAALDAVLVPSAALPESLLSDPPNALTGTMSILAGGGALIASSYQFSLTQENNKVQATHTNLGKGTGRPAEGSGERTGACHHHTHDSTLLVVHALHFC